MKNCGEFDCTLNIRQVKNGFLVECNDLGYRSNTVHEYFEDAINSIAKAFSLLEIGERIVLSATKESKEK